MTNYGPIETLSDPETDKKLRELLETGGLVPIDIEVTSFQRDRPTILEITPPGGNVFYRIEGITSRHRHGEFMIQHAEIGDRVVLRNVDVCIYNLGHLVPNALDVIHAGVPLRLTVQPNIELAVIPTLSMTLWGHVYTTEPAAAFRDPSTWTINDITEKVQRPLFVALRLLKQHKIEIKDDELRAIMDKCAKLL